MQVKLTVEGLITYEQAAEILGVSRPAIYWMEKQHKVHPIFIAGKRFLEKSEVDRLKKRRAAVVTTAQSKGGD